MGRFQIPCSTNWKPFDASATRKPEILVSPTRHRLSRQQSSLIARILNLRGSAEGVRHKVHRPACSRGERYGLWKAPNRHVSTSACKRSRCSAHASGKSQPLAARPPAPSNGQALHLIERSFGGGEVTELCLKEGIAQSLFYPWSKEFTKAGKCRLAGGTARAATA